MNKKALSESDICDKFIRPAMEKAGWDGMVQVYREFPLRAGRVVVRGRRAKRDASTVLRADYALFFKPNIPLAVVEAKDNNHAMGAGMAQAINYAQLLDVPFSFASNGDGFVFRDATLADGGTGTQPDARRVPITCGTVGTLLCLEGLDARSAPGHRA
jgi:type I restriction enzyme R subunit